MERTVLDNRYDLVRTLGGGGMGEVYLARDQVLDRDVALKVLRRQYAGDDEFAERFKREAMHAASLSHPNIVQVYDRGQTEDGAAYIAMEYVPGGTLKEKITREGPLESAVAASIGSQVAEALGAAHARGVVHRDIKPQNVLLTGKGEAKVADFGIARAASAVTISQTGSVMGTAGYMSPEQALGKPATPRSDLYSLGVVLYEAITGELPYTADNPIAVSMKHVNEPLRPPREVDPQIPEGMNALVVKLLAKDPEGRYASADELADDLYRVSRGVTPVAAWLAAGPQNLPRTDPPGASSRATTAEAAPAASAKKRRRLPFPVLILLLLALIGLGWILSSPIQDFGLGDLLGNPAQGVVVPSVESLTRDQAVEELVAAELRTETREVESSDAEAGIVLDQKPSDGKSVRRNSTVVLTVGAGSSNVDVPGVVGLNIFEAEAELAQAGLTVGLRNEIPSESVPEGEVIEQGIEPGTAVAPGTAVNLGISSGPSPAPASSSSSASPSSSASAQASDPSSTTTENPAPAERATPTQPGGGRVRIQPGNAAPESAVPEDAVPGDAFPEGAVPEGAESEGAESEGPEGD
ncbi:MAG: Stk1 family PASTA domain-containing Ser/Thr kinase [Rubrobacter sp.]